MLAFVAVGTALVFTAATADQATPLTAVYVFSFVERDGPWNIWEGTGSGTVVGPSTVANRVRISGSKAEGTATITAANGDLLDYEFTQTFDEATGSWTGPFTIVGGTGRFADATGGGTTVAKVVGGIGTGSLDGTISF